MDYQSKSTEYLERLRDNILSGTSILTRDMEEIHSIFCLRRKARDTDENAVGEIEEILSQRPFKATAQ